jgi:hypothetical protein
MFYLILSYQGGRAVYEECSAILNTDSINADTPSPTLLHYAMVGAAASDAALLDRREPPIFRFSKFRCGPIDGARALELLAATGSLHIGAGRDRTGRGAPVDSIGWPHARARAVADSLAADFYFAMIRSRRVGPAAW